MIAQESLDRLKYYQLCTRRHNMSVARLLPYTRCRMVYKVVRVMRKVNVTAQLSVIQFEIHRDYGPHCDPMAIHFFLSSSTPHLNFAYPRGEIAQSIFGLFQN